MCQQCSHDAVVPPPHSSQQNMSVLFLFFVFKVQLTCSGAAISPPVWVGDTVCCQALKCPSLLADTSVAVRWSAAAGAKHMAVIPSSWGAEMVVSSTKLEMRRELRNIWTPLFNPLVSLSGQIDPGSQRKHS